MSFVSFMSSTVGRGVRIIAGLGIIAGGIAIGGAGGVAIAVVGVVPLLAGLANVCLFGPLLGARFRGRPGGAR